MSVTIADIMELPSMSGAKIVAGEVGLTRTILSVTVLECDNPKLTGNEILNVSHPFGSEIVITGFIASRNNVEAQCESIRRLSEGGAGGVILYYVGCFISVLNKKVVETANNLDFPLIVMPEKRMELRYSDAIFEIVEAIIRDQLNDTYFASEILEKILHLEGSLRSVNNVLDMMRDRVHYSFFIIDEHYRLLNVSEWPKERELPIGDILMEFRTREMNDFKKELFDIQGSKFWASRILVNEDNGKKLFLIIVKEAEDLSLDVCKQATEVMKTYLMLWADNHGSIEVKQLIKSILNDEPSKMRRIAEILKIKIEGLSDMVIISFTGNNEEEIEYKDIEMTRKIAKDFFESYSCQMISDIFEKEIVGFINPKGMKIRELLEELQKLLIKSGYACIISFYDHLASPKEAKDAYELYKAFRAYALEIYLNKNIITSAEMNMAKQCKDIFALPAQETTERRRVLRPINRGGKTKELLKTLGVYLLDADCDVSLTSELVYAHKNTIKYRIKLINDLLGYECDKMPESYELYIACALERLNGELI